MDLAAFGISKIQIFLLVLTRTAGIFTLTPTFGSNHIPANVRIAMAVGLALIFLPMVNAPAQMPGDIPNMALMICREAMIGLIIGFVCTMVFSTIESAGHLVDSQSGFGFASMVDPGSGNNGTVASRFQNLLAMLLFFATNAHHVMIRGLADSFTIAPIGQVDLNPALAGGAITIFTSLFVVAVRIAAPLLAALFLADLALAMLSKLVPQMNVFIVGLPFKLGLALVGLLITLPFNAVISHQLFGDTYRYIGDLVGLTLH
jgi:flagellar biosynthetic protein FliR